MVSTPHRSGRRGPGIRRLLAVSLLAFPLAALVACQGDGLGPGEESKDSAAREEHWLTAALTYYDGGKYARAEEMFARVVAENPQNQKARHGLARSKLMQGTPEKLREAEALLAQLVQEDWTHAERGDVKFEVESGLAQTYSQLADHYERDIHFIDDRLRTDPTANASELRSQLQKQVQMRNSLLGKAIPIWERVLETSRDSPYALASLAKAHLQLGNDDRGQWYAERYLALSQQSQRNWRRQMDEWTQRAGRGNVTDEQRRFFVSRIQGARQKETQMHLLLGSVQMRRGDYPAAIRSYSEVIRLDPTVPAARVERAQAYGSVGDFRRALGDLEEYLKMTDPIAHRQQRLEAGGLVQRYRLALGLETGMEPAAVSEPPAPRPAQFPPTSR